jgi:glucosamine-6-phosphate deaminase
MKLIPNNSRLDMGIAAGKAVENKILEMLEEKAGIRIIFAAAPSQIEMLDYLRESKLIPWEKITAFHMDEYIGLDGASPALFANFLKRHLFDHVPFHQVHLINGLEDPDRECARYSRLLAEAPIDIVCMGIGENGHIAFNDPPVADFNDPVPVKKVKLETVCRQQQVNDGCFDTLADVPEYALTLTIPTLIQAGYISCVVPGAAKKEAVYNTLLGPVNHRCPASIIKTLEHCDLFLDQDSYPTAVGDLEYPDNFVSNHCISGFPCLINHHDNTWGSMVELKNHPPAENEYFGPGLADLQINGINGIDFNHPDLTPEAVFKATSYLLSQGVTTYLPTLITNSPETIEKLLKTLVRACEKYPLVDQCIEGIHLEGPFISPSPGAKGAHDEQYIQNPSWNLIETFQEISGNRIRLVTMAPESEGGMEFIQRCVGAGIKVAIGHSSADSRTISAAVAAGASLSTHLGNGIPLELPRHPNLLWDQLAADDLYTSLIADGFHVPDNFLKVVFKLKGRKAFLVSDATNFAGMPSGEYDAHIGSKVILSEAGRLSVKNEDGLLAGAGKNLLENVHYLVQSKLKPLSSAWAMASCIPLEYLNGEPAPSRRGDWVRFELLGEAIRILQVYKNSKLVYDVAEETDTVEK